MSNSRALPEHDLVLEIVFILFLLYVLRTHFVVDLLADKFSCV
jgi:hypothetical protein